MQNDKTKELVEIINFLLNWLEDEHLGTREEAIKQIIEIWRINLW